jgi:hypothetical protein
MLGTAGVWTSAKIAPHAPDCDHEPRNLSTCRLDAKFIRLIKTGVIRTAHDNRRRNLVMALPRVSPLALTIIALLAAQGTAGTARAQMPGQQQMPPCYSDFAPLRAEAEKRAAAIQATQGNKKQKPPLPEVCKLFRSFTDAELKVVKYAEANAAWCNIPAQAVTQMRASLTEHVTLKDKICAAAANAPQGGPPKPSGPNLGEALGTRVITTPDNVSSGRGTLDTLTGNALTR